MAYIGKQPLVGNFVKLDAITATATTTFNLTNGGVAYYPQSANNCLVSLNGVIQSPTTSFTISGSTIVFASALTATDVIDFILVLGDVLNIGTPSDATVGFSKVTSNLITGATAETSIAGGDSVLIYDDSASALRKMTRTNFVAGVGGVNTPAFEARLSADMTGLFASTDTLVEANTEKFDIGGCYNNTGSSTTLNGLTAPAYSFVPNVSGKYFVYGIVRTDATTTFPNDAYVKIFKNGSVSEQQQNASSGSRFLTTIQRTIILNGTGDYIQLYAIAYGSSGLIFTGGNQMAFGAYRIIE